MERLHDPLMRWMRSMHAERTAQLSLVLSRMKRLEQSELGVKARARSCVRKFAQLTHVCTRGQPEFQCNLEAAIRTLARIKDAPTPLEKLQVMRHASDDIVAAVEKHVQGLNLDASAVAARAGARGALTA